MKESARVTPSRLARSNTNTLTTAATMYPAERRRRQRLSLHRPRARRATPTRRRATE